MMRYALFYDYVDDVVEARAPHRDAHLALIREWADDGRVLAGGALGDPPHSALIVFASAEDAEAFPGLDPYVANGVATQWRVEPWNVVVGG
jgi:uncharacterized protein YciI